MSGPTREALAIIPARGGSKGIPRKNVKLIAGKPLVAYSILHAKQAPSVRRIVVSTDDEEIGDVSRKWGAEVIRRPPEISGDTASSESALLHVLDCLKDSESYEPDLVVFLQATSPCRATGEIQKAIDTLVGENADSLFSARLIEGFVWRSTGPTPVNYDPVHRPRRQDLSENLLEENGSLYVFKPWVLRQFNSRLGGRIAVHRMSPLDSFQLDAAGDFELLEALMRYRGVSLFASDGERAGVRCAPPVSFHPSSLKEIKLLVLDFDGVMTDNRVLVAEDGKEAVFCSREDGLGLEMLKKAGATEIVVISKEKNPVVAARCRKLGIECIQNCDDKLATLRLISESRGLKPEQIAYVGNDVNDLPCIHWAGLPIAVSDALPEILAAAKYITSKPGGRGAVREICDLLLRFNLQA